MRIVAQALNVGIGGLKLESRIVVFLGGHFLFNSISDYMSHVDST